MANIKIQGEAIKTKKDAEKFLKDVDSPIVDEGWVEHTHKLDDKEKMWNKRLYDRLKDRLANHQFGFNWKPGQYEAIFGKKDED